MDHRGDGRLLNIYLNDHRAGAAAGANLARRIADAAVDTPRGSELASVANEIEEDRQFLDRLMADQGVAVRHTRVAAGWLAERLSRLKANGYLVRRSPLSDVLELEGLMAGVEAKRALWSTLRASSVGSAEQLDGYIARAESHRTRLEEQHRQTLATTPLGP